MADLARFTGRPLGQRAAGGPRETILASVRFFSDAPDTTTIRWYAVPPDRPVMPVSSFVAWEAWHNENGPRSNMLWGQLGTQGQQADPPPRYVHDADPRDSFNADHYCGTPDQWAGRLRLATPADVGSLTCCNAIRSRVGLEVLPSSSYATSVSACANCKVTMPSSWQVTVAGATGRGAFFNGLWDITHDAGCIWRVSRPVGGGHIGTAEFDPTNFSLPVALRFFIALGFFQADYQLAAPPWACHSATTAALISAGPLGTMPAALTLTPTP